MFWGLIMEPNKRYTQVVEKPFHISQAAMDTSTGDIDPCQVMVVVDSKNFLVCTLQKGKNIQVPLDLYFKTGDAVSFLTNGKCNVHLTGYLDPEFEDLEGEIGLEGEDEAPTLVLAKNKRKLENNHAATAVKKIKKTGKNAAAAIDDSENSEDDDDDDQLQKFLDGEDIDTDENDDSFKITSVEGDSDEEEDEDDEEEEEDDDDDDDDEDDEEEEEEEETPKKKKKAAVPASPESANSTLDSSKEDAVDTSKLSKSQKRRLKKKLQQQSKQPQVNGVDKAKKEEAEKPQKAEKKKPEAKQEEEKKEKKQLSGGVAVEDLKVGSGPVAKAGKVVMVYYEGRLKQNNKMFDNCAKGPGFKFRLGSKEVITGWDVGIAGMKVGGKRKIVCPPAMAYGAKGSPPVIPPNSTLVFEVELKNVK